ncbi:hypothetical protein ACQKM9_09245 [Viridibacillus sp. NPDC093762]|uniref:hypothetical protein n=1 Tax=Viridibacillus sp. NPDC093762 TaxID=3390720 RepID=UPI003CFE03A4
MKKGKITLIGTIIILFVATFLFINNSSTKGEIGETPPSISPEKQAEKEKKIKENKRSRGNTNPTLSRKWLF